MKEEITDDMFDEFTETIKVAGEKFERIKSIVTYLVANYTYYNQRVEELCSVADMNNNVCVKQYNLTEDEEEIILSTKPLREIAKKLFENEKNNLCTYENLGKSLDVINKCFVGSPKEIEKYTLSLLEPIKLVIAKISEDKLKETMNIIAFYEEDIKNYTPPKEKSLIFIILKTTIREAISKLKKESKLTNDELNSYKTYLLDTIYKWERKAINQKETNKVYTALNNILQYSRIKNHIILDLKETIVISSKNFLTMKNNDFLIFLLKVTFGDIRQNKDRYNSIKRLCTAIMHPDTYNRYNLK